jgi:uncharacterized protein (DUF4415 family)
MNAKHTKHTAKSKTNWRKLYQATDEEINYTDSPATTEDFWKDAEVVMPPHKVHLSLRLDDDVVAFFKREGRGYQTKINAVLKSYMRAHSPSKTDLQRHL